MLPARRSYHRGARALRSFSAAGFTLIELMFVAAIIVALAGFAVSGIIGAKQRAAIGRAKSELALLAQALEDYKRHYGDYPQTGAAAQATLTPTALIGSTTAQALLFNALTGVYAPTNLTTRINGPTFIDVSKFTVEGTLVATTFAIPTGSPPAKPLVQSSFLDPWGNRYLYYYKNPRNVAAWRAPSYVLYSAGPDGKLGTASTGAGTTDNGLTPASGLYSGTGQTTGFNADNLYADKLP